MHATDPAYLILFEITILTIFGEDYKMLKSPFSTLLSNKRSLCSSLNVRNQYMLSLEISCGGTLQKLKTGVELQE
jgi:hypothetical protein